MTSTVSTRSGRLIGEMRRGVHAFRGIPYAEAPRFDLRWQPPQPVRPWHDVRRVVRYGPSAPQSPAMMMLVRRLIGVALQQQSQDCLYLNVFTPATDRRRRPVLVWIHGGAFIMGSAAAALYDGSYLAADAVVVTINYRLGALGFLNAREILPEQPATNLGVRDQIAALEWVRDNIEAFGGDPECVTLFGESAGGMSVSTLLGVPAARGLFQRAVAQSGAAHNVSSPEHASLVAHCFLEELGAKRFDDLEKASVFEIVEAQGRVNNRMGIATGILAWQPSVDGDLIPEQPLAAVAAGRGAKVPLLIGTNRDEWKLFMLGDRRGRRLDAPGLERRLMRVFGNAETALTERAIKAYQGASAGRGRETPSDIWIAIQSDRIFHHPAHSLAEFHARHVSDTRTYLFDWKPPLTRGAVGACHGLDIPFVFGTHRLPLLRPLVGLGREPARLSQRMMHAWIAFARSGNPSHEGLPAWPAYEAGERISMVLGREPRALRDPFAAALRFWSEVDPLREQIEQT